MHSALRKLHSAVKAHKAAHSLFKEAAGVHTHDMDASIEYLKEAGENDPRVMGYISALTRVMNQHRAALNVLHSSAGLFDDTMSRVATGLGAHLGVDLNMSKRNVQLASDRQGGTDSPGAISDMHGINHKLDAGKSLNAWELQKAMDNLAERMPKLGNDLNACPSGWRTLIGMAVSKREHPNPATGSGRMSGRG